LKSKKIEEIKDTFELQLESGIDINGYYHVSIDTTKEWLEKTK